MIEAVRIPGTQGMIGVVIGATGGLAVAAHLGRAIVTTGMIMGVGVTTGVMTGVAIGTETVGGLVIVAVAPAGVEMTTGRRRRARLGLMIANAGGVARLATLRASALRPKSRLMLHRLAAVLAAVAGQTRAVRLGILPAAAGSRYCRASISYAPGVIAGERQEPACDV